jgi:hypothetical protein
MLEHGFGAAEPEAEKPRANGCANGAASNALAQARTDEAETA